MRETGVTFEPVGASRRSGSSVGPTTLPRRRLFLASDLSRFVTGTTDPRRRWQLGRRRLAQDRRLVSEPLGPEPVFRHLDDPDVAWQQVKRQRNADGTESSVWEKWLAFSPDPQYLSLYAKYDPGMMVRRHGHFSPHVVFVIAGEITCGDRVCPLGYPHRAPARCGLRTVPGRPRGRHPLRGDDGRSTLVG